MVAFQENIIFSLQTADVSEISCEISIYNLREVSIEFQENNNGLLFCADRRSLWGYFSMSVITK